MWSENGFSLYKYCIENRVVKMIATNTQSKQYIYCEEQEQETYKQIHVFIYFAIGFVIDHRIYEKEKWHENGN